MKFVNSIISIITAKTTRIKMSGIEGRIISVYECVAWKAENVEEKHPSFIITFEDGTQKVIVATTKEKEEFVRKSFEEMFYITLRCGCKVVRDGDEHRQAIVDIDGENPICEECYDDEYEDEDSEEEDENLRSCDCCGAEKDKEGVAHTYSSLFEDENEGTWNCYECLKN